MKGSDNGLMDGYKFSFKKDDNPAFSTPKFVSIELPSGSLNGNHQQNQPIPSTSFKQKNICKNVRSKFFQSKIHSLSKTNRDTSIITTEQKIVKDNNSVHRQQKNNRRVIHTVKPKKFCNKKLETPTKEDHHQQKSRFLHGKLFMQNDSILRRSRSQRNSLKSEEQENDSYLKIYRKDKNKKLFSKQKTNKQKILIKNHISVMNFLDIHTDQSPKSTSSMRNFSQRKKYDNSNLLSPMQKQINRSAMDIINASLFPQTTKSIKFYENVSTKKKMLNNSSTIKYNNQTQDIERNLGNSKYPIHNKFFKNKVQQGNDKISELSAKIQKLRLQGLEKNESFQA